MWHQGWDPHPQRPSLPPGRDRPGCTGPCLPAAPRRVCHSLSSPPYPRPLVTSTFFVVPKHPQSPGLSKCVSLALSPLVPPMCPEYCGVGWGGTYLCQAHVPLISHFPPCSSKNTEVPQGSAASRKESRMQTVTPSPGPSLTAEPVSCPPFAPLPTLGWVPLPPGPDEVLGGLLLTPTAA